jgi:lysophospholipase L1-like esterase
VGSPPSPDDLDRPEIPEAAGARDVPAPPPDDALIPAALRSPSTVAMLTVALLTALPYAVPKLARFRLLSPLAPGQSLVEPKRAPAPVASVGEVTLAFGTDDRGDLAQPEQVELPAAAAEVLPDAAKGEDEPPRSLEDPTGHALDPFYAKLADVARKKPGSIARVTYFGDSIVASDFVTGTLRRKLQGRFGDAGHGFMLLANAWPGYFHNDVTRFAAPGWQVSRVVGPFAKDGLYGLGGVSFRSQGPGAFSRFGTAKAGTFGRAVSRFTIDYLAHPDGGPMRVRIDGADKETVDTKADAPKSEQRTYEVPDGPHELEVRADGAGVRAFGVVMERDEPGVVLDAIGIQGCRIRFLDKSDDAHFNEQLKMRNPSLTVFEYGMNESEDGELYPLDQYEATMKGVLEQVRAALPESACLLVGPMDRADRRGDVFTSRPVIPKLSRIQRKVAAEVGCAFFDTFDAMGGTGSMGVWVQRGLGGADLAHPSSAGAEVLGRWVYSALMEGYEHYEAARAKR